MGSVWSATHTITNRRYALKFLKGADVRPELRRRFIREARAASAVQHPCVVVVHDVIEIDEDTPMMVMDLLEGESLRTRLKRVGQFSLSEVADIMLPVVSAVGAAHGAGIVHRDLKPDNIFLVEPARGAADVRVLDFGIAKLTADDTNPDTAALTGTGALLGTPVYMSPEQGFGERDIDHRTDIWALGVVMYEMLSGVRPVEGENLGQVLKRLMSDGITPIEVLEPDLPEKVTKLIGSMLARERNDRPADLRAVAAVLQQFTEAKVPDVPAPGSMRSSRDELDSMPSNRFVVTDGARGEGPTAIADGSRAMAPDTHAATANSVVEANTSRRRLAVAAVVLVSGVGLFAMGRGGGSPPMEEGAGSLASSPSPVSAPAVASAASAPLEEAEPEPAKPETTASAEVALPAPSAAPSSIPEASPPPPKPASKPRPQFRPRPAPRPASRPAPSPAPAPAPNRKGGLVDEPPF